MEDTKIVQMYWDRDSDAIVHTADKYGAYLRTIAVNIIGSHEDAEECVNDTYMSAWRAMPPHRPMILSTFLGKITRNLSFNRYKQIHADKRGGSQIPYVLDELAECIAGTGSVEQTLEYDQLVATIDTFLDTLSTEKRVMFVRRYWYNDSMADIAGRFGKREKTVSKSLERIRRDLRHYLEERGYRVE
ncbi:MAG: RNA polymerase sigma factor [Lachnospiraceae bacterium]|nr:RNA polymerase sigma factor [Lachnospiraceae bacterium]